MDKRLHIPLLFLLAGVAAPLPAAAHDDDDDLEIVTLSNRADLISGGDALVEIRVPRHTSLSWVKVKLNGHDVTSSFTANASARTLRGLVTGLVEGRNDLVADPDGKGHGKEVRLTITNHPQGGPVLSGPQITPFFCAQPLNPAIPFQPATATTPAPSYSGLSTLATGAECNIASEYRLYYRTTATPCSFAIPDPTPGVGITATTAPTPSTPPANGCFKPYDPALPAPVDLATTITDHGVTVPYIVRVERGTMNRGIYDIAVLFNPSQPWASGVAPQAQWNGKVLYQFGASTGQPRRQSRPATAWTGSDAALARGYLIAVNSMTDSSLNSNRVSMSETVMMMKERVGDRYGPIKFTMGNGCSGGSINSNTNASIMPGNLDGITISCAYPDSETTGIEVGDCTLLAEAYNKPQWAALQTGLTQAQINAKKAAINGHPDQTGCQGWYNAFGSNGKVGNYVQRFVLDFTSGVVGTIPNSQPTNNCQMPLAGVYNPAANPTGARCSAWDWAASIFGRAANDLSTDPLDLRARDTRDNTGVQYGLKAMLSGAISAEEFVTLNEVIGGTDKDSNFSAARTLADRRALEIAYRAGIVMSGKQYAKTAVIDLRGWDDAGAGIPIHYQWRTFSIRDRLDREYGDHGNQVMWRFSTGLLPPAVGPGSELPAQAFLTMDAWLTALKADTSDRRIENKVRSTKPANAVDFCIVPVSADNPDGREYNLALCESKVARYKVGSSPRQVAGGPLSENILKCRLQPLNSADYSPVMLSSAQLARLQAVFPDGVCDWDRPGVEQERARAPRDYTDGPGGEPLGDEPESREGKGRDGHHGWWHGWNHDD